MLHLFVLDHADIVLDELQGLNSLNEVLLVEVLLVAHVVLILWHLSNQIVQAFRLPFLLVLGLTW